MGSERNVGSHQDEAIGGKSRAVSKAELNMNPAARGALTAREFGNGPQNELDIAESFDEMERQISRVQQGDLSGVEAMLTAQAVSLDGVFNELARRAAANFIGHMDAAETYLRLAFKAQSQCRATLETLAEVKYPKSATFIKQANIAAQQQVNNGRDSDRQPTTSRAREKELNPHPKLLEHANEKRLVTRTKSEAGRADQDVASLGKVHRTAERSRKSRR